MLGHVAIYDAVTYVKLYLWHGNAQIENIIGK